MEKVIRFADNASVEELYEAIALLNSKLSEKKRELASTLTLGSIISYGDGKSGKVVMISESGVQITSDELKNKRMLKWDDITL